MTVQYVYARKPDYVLHINRLQNLTHNTVIRYRDHYCSTSWHVVIHIKNIYQTLRQTAVSYPDDHAAECDASFVTDESYIWIIWDNASAFVMINISGTRYRNLFPFPRRFLIHLQPSCFTTQQTMSNINILYLYESELTRHQLCSLNHTVLTTDRK